MSAGSHRNDDRGSAGGRGGGGGGGGPCGACKFLRRKCVKGCVFAPYFDSEQGTAHFAAVHKVFGASNASKLLLRVPAHKRLDAVVSLCYEALSRVRDPVYGCVGHIFTLQQQVVSLQAELAYVQARLSILHRLPSAAPPRQQSPTPTFHRPSSDLESSTNMPVHFDPCQSAVASFCSPLDDDEFEDGDLRALAREFVSKYLSEVKCRPSTSP